MMLDELDKLASKGTGDPTAALLDVLDPEQQREFVDHFIDVPFDISCVFFIATANALDSVPEALRDRLEVTRMSGYTEEEKTQIAVRHIIPRQMEWHALYEGDVRWEPDALRTIVGSYTREAGVRQLEREIATLCRRVATLVAQEDKTARRPYCVNEELILEVLGTPRFLPEEPESTDQPGIVTGVFWTPVGGDVMHIEAIMMPGGKTLTVTGQLGEVMRESAQAALSYVRAHAAEMGIEPDFYETNDIHLHIPSGAVAKDGPSAGITLAVALVSLLTRTAVPGDVAMSGELTLRGRVLPVGGIKEKVLAARRAGLRRVILPSQNRRDLDEVQHEILSALEFTFVDTMDEVLEAAFPRRIVRRATRSRSARSRPDRSVSDGTSAAAMPR
jgi:ATP-dependent Lon protease